MISVICAVQGEPEHKSLGVTPSKTFDKDLSRSEFVTDVAGRRGVDVCEGGNACNFCGQPADSKGRHAWSCMAGGDAAVEHNNVRDLVFDYCKRGLLQPDLEAAGVLRDLPCPQAKRRPADILVCSSAVLATSLPDGGRSFRFPRVALDFAVINALGAGHWDLTFWQSGASAEA